MEVGVRDGARGVGKLQLRGASVGANCGRDVMQLPSVSTQPSKVQTDIIQTSSLKNKRCLDTEYQWSMN